VWVAEGWTGRAAGLRGRGLTEEKETRKRDKERIEGKVEEWRNWMGTETEREREGGRCRREEEKRELPKGERERERKAKARD
jgi:hypothetical protein